MGMSPPENAIVQVVEADCLAVLPNRTACFFNWRCSSVFSRASQPTATSLLPIYLHVTSRWHASQELSKEAGVLDLVNKLLHLVGCLFLPGITDSLANDHTFSPIRTTGPQMKEQEMAMQDHARMHTNWNKAISINLCIECSERQPSITTLSVESVTTKQYLGPSVQMKWLLTNHASLTRF